jgi:hypothetical protein
MNVACSGDLSRTALIQQTQHCNAGGGDGQKPLREPREIIRLLMCAYSVN